MPADTGTGGGVFAPSPTEFLNRSLSRPSRAPATASEGASWNYFVVLTIVFLAYLVAGKLGQATTTIRSGNIGPVWPAYGVALASFLWCGFRIWPAVAAGALVVAVGNPVPMMTAAGQAAGSAIAAAAGAYMLRRISGFDPSLSRLRDAIGFIVIGAFGSAVISSTIGMASLYEAGIQSYSGLPSAWFIYWFGDSTGALLVTPLVFTLPQLLNIRAPRQILEFLGLIGLLTVACLVVFGDVPLVPVRLDALGFAIVPFVMWAAISFGIAGSAVTVLLIAIISTTFTAFDRGPFSTGTPLMNAAMLDVLFAVLSVTGLTLAAVIAERQRAQSDRDAVIRGQATAEALSRLSQKLLEAQEEERRRIARELHDDIAQRLAVLTVQLSELENGSPGLDGSIPALHNQARQLASDVQSLSHTLHSSKLELLGLAASLKLFCKEFSEKQNVEIEVRAGEIRKPLSPGMSLALFRTMQEALFNASRHSGVRRCTVELRDADDSIHLVVSDRGAGFAVAAALRGRGIGLVSMQERMKLVGGTLSIESHVGRGTIVHARVPLSDS